MLMLLSPLIVVLKPFKTHGTGTSLPACSYASPPPRAGACWALTLRWQEASAAPAVEVLGRYDTLGFAHLRWSPLREPVIHVAQI